MELQNNLKITKCRYCGEDIKFNIELKRAVQFDNPDRLHICASRKISCRYCGQPIYFSIKKNSEGLSTPFDWETQLKHKCLKKKENK